MPSRSERRISRPVRNGLTALLVAVVLVVSAAGTVLATPANDAFGHATLVGSLPSTSSSDTTSATLQASEPTPSCDSGISGSVWWRYNATASRHLLAYLDGGQTLAVYRGTSLSGLTELACSSYGGNLNFDVASGQTIYVQVSDDPGFGGPVTLHVKLQAPPANDAFGHATLVGSLPSTSSSDTTSATLQASEPTPSCDSGISGSVWWRYNATASRHLLAYLDGGQTLAVYRGTSLSGLTELACSSYGGNLNFDVASGQTIYVQVSDDPGFGGPVTLHVKLQP